jgi:hypothetical protein
LRHVTIPVNFLNLDGAIGKRDTLCVSLKETLQEMKHLNRATFLTILTVGLSGLQSILLHIGTTDFAHKYFTIYFFVELFILLLTLATGLKKKTYAILFLLAFIFEAVWFFINERPISPDVLSMLIVGATRIYILIWVIKRLTKLINGKLHFGAA